MPTLKRLLIATDYSDCSRAAFEAALGLATEFGASIDIVHVWSAPYFGPGYGYGNSATVIDPSQHQSLFELVRQRAMDDMRAFASSVPVAPSVQITTHVESGEPASKLLEIAERDKPDLILVGTHGRTGARRWLLGSVAERIVQHAPSAVLTVPPPSPTR